MRRQKCSSEPGKYNLVEKKCKSQHNLAGALAKNFLRVAPGKKQVVQVEMKKRKEKKTHGADV